jgi:hypothetical protein
MLLYWILDDSAFISCVCATSEGHRCLFRFARPSLELRLKSYRILSLENGSSQNACDAGDIIENDEFSSSELGHGIATLESSMLLVEVKNT